jgi:hypothetical protein
VPQSRTKTLLFAIQVFFHFLVVSDKSEIVQKVFPFFIILRTICLPFSILSISGKHQERTKPNRTTSDVVDAVSNLNISSECKTFFFFFTQNQLCLCKQKQLARSYTGSFF